MFKKDGDNPLNQSLDDYINDQKFRKRSSLDDATSLRSSNGRSFKKENSPWTKGRSFNNNNRTWRFPTRNSMHTCRRVQCCDRSHWAIHSRQWNACRCAHFLDNIQNNWGTDNNYSYKSKRDNNQGKLRRSKSYDSVASASSFRSNRSFNTYNRQSNINLNRYHANDNRNNKNNDDPWRCPLDYSIQTEIREMQRQFAQTSETSPLHRLKVNAPKCEPKQFDTGITLTIRIGRYYKPIGKQ